MHHLFLVRNTVVLLDVISAGRILTSYLLRITYCIFCSESSQGYADNFCSIQKDVKNCRVIIMQRPFFQMENSEKMLI